MMPSIYEFIQKNLKISWYFKKHKPSNVSPKHLVRLCRRRTDFITIINEAISSPKQDWDEDLIKRVIKHILGEERTGVSVYRSDTLDPCDIGHALAVIAEGIGNPSLRSDARKRVSGCKRGSLLIPVICFPESTNYKFTPNNNLNFYPANDFHYDLTINDATELAISILENISNQKIAWTFLEQDVTYRLQAVIVYSHCLKNFGKIDAKNPPCHWIDGENLSASEQIDTLKYLVQTTLIDSPTSSL